MKVEGHGRIIVQVTRMGRVAALLLIAAAGGPHELLAQTGTSQTYTITEHTQPVGAAAVTVTPSEDGWRVDSTSRLGGSLGLDIRRFEVTYDRQWGTKFVTLDWARGNDHRIIQVAVGATRAQTDTVIPDREARFGTHRVTPGTIALPDYVVGAFVALAARADRLDPGASLPLLLTPRGEVTAEVDAVRLEALDTASGRIMARHVSLLVYRDIQTPIEIWTDRGDLLRADLPLDGISAARADLKTGSGQ